MIQQTSRFAFVDEGEALRRLGVDRDTLLAFVQSKRLRAYPGVGKGNFYKLKDLDSLYSELHAQDEAAATHDAAEGEAATPGRKLFDPAYKVHVRLQADLKWYDLEDEDLQAWVREMHADGYTRQRTNITKVIAKLERLIELMDEAAAHWQVLEAPVSAQPQVPEKGEPAAKPARKSLPMFTPAPQAQLQQSQQPQPIQPLLSPTRKKPVRKPLPMAEAPAKTEE